MSLVVSIVSHNQGNLVGSLLNDLKRFHPGRPWQVIVTINCPEKPAFGEMDFDFDLTIVKNRHPRGFGANHNAAFRLKPSEFFAVLNPDLRLTRDPFGPLTSALDDKEIGVIAPLIFNEDHLIEDSARRLPTPGRLLKRYLGRKGEGRLDYGMNRMINPDWLAGIFMLFPSPVFAAMKGFDERYFLYFEDVDLCSRLRLAGYKIALDPTVSVVHQARRDSHRRPRYLLWHTISGIRFFSSRIFWSVLLKEFKGPSEIQ
jgi:GT2 family glycosyltransferase